MSPDTSWVKDGARCIFTGGLSSKGNNRIIKSKDDSMFDLFEADENWKLTGNRRRTASAGHIVLEEYTPYIDPIPDWIYDRAEVIEDCSGDKVTLIELKDGDWIIDRSRQVFRGPYSTEQIESHTREIPKPKILNDEEMDRAKQVYYGFGIRNQAPVSAIAWISKEHGGVEQNQLNELLNSLSQGYQDRNL